MRKTLAIFQTSLRRLLTLLLITYLVSVAAGYPSGHLSGSADGDSSSGRLNRFFDEKCIRLKDIKVGRHYYQKAKRKVKSCNGLTYSREYQFFSESSKRLLDISYFRRRRRVTARATSIKDKYTKLNMTSQTCPDNKHIVRIQGIQRQTHLCFTMKGVLIQRGDRHRSVRCAFYERQVQEPGYGSHSELVSVFNPNFVVAFNSNGYRLRGGRYTGRCNHLTSYNKRQERIEDWHSSEMVYKSSNTSQSKVILRLSGTSSSEQRTTGARKLRHSKKRQRNNNSKEKRPYSSKFSKSNHRRRHMGRKLRRNRLLRRLNNKR